MRLIVRLGLEAMRTLKCCLLLAIALLALQASPGRTQTQTICGQPLDADLAAMHERIKQLPGATLPPSRNLDFDVVSFPDQLWNFTKRSHPAYPSVACRRIIKDADGARRVATQLQCNASKAACDRLAADYTALDKEIMEAIKKQAPKR
jgi:hypothetical protein